MNARKIVVLALFAAACAATSSSAGTWTRTPGGVEFRVVESSAESLPVSAAVMRFDPTEHRLRAVAEEAPGRLAASFAEQPGVLAAVNANLTSGDGCATGWILTDGGQLADKRSRLGAVLTVEDGGRVRLWRARGFRGQIEPRNAVQGGPLLAIEGFPDPTLRPDLLRRAFVALDREGRVVLGVTSGPVHAKELASFLTRTEEAGGLGALDVMEFGGGDEAQLFVRDAGGEGDHHLDGSARPVPVLLVVEAAGP